MLPSSGAKLEASEKVFRFVIDEAEGTPVRIASKQAVEPQA
jgi:hypothetical protein